jgi:phasin
MTVAHGAVAIGDLDLRIQGSPTVRRGRSDSTGAIHMADERFEIPKEMRSMAEASFDQARKAFETFMGTAQQTASTFSGTGEAARANAKDISAKAITFAEKNVQASLAYAQQLIHATDLAEVMRLHTEYVQTQMRTLADQASEIGQAVTRAALDATKPK